MIPGTSRSAATIIGALLLGCSRKLAAEFSFYLAIPTIISASVYSLVKTQISFSLHDLLILTTGFVVSFVVAIGVIKFLMNFIKKHSFVVLLLPDRPGDYFIDLAFQYNTCQLIFTCRRWYTVGLQIIHCKLNSE